MFSLIYCTYILCLRAVYVLIFYSCTCGRTLIKHGLPPFNICMNWVSYSFFFVNRICSHCFLAPVNSCTPVLPEMATHMFWAQHSEHCIEPQFYEKELDFNSCSWQLDTWNNGNTDIRYVYFNCIDFSTFFFIIFKHVSSNPKWNRWIFLLWICFYIH